MSQSLIVLWNIASGKLQEYASQWVHNKTFFLRDVCYGVWIYVWALCHRCYLFTRRQFQKVCAKLGYMHLRIKNAVFFYRCNMFKLYYHHSMLEENLQTYLTRAISLNLLQHSLMLGKTHQLTRYFLGW
jgi:hypothetical protein